MVKRRKSTKKTLARKSVARQTAPRKAANVLRDTWASTLGALTSAQAEMEKQIRLLLKKNKINAKDASGMLKELSTRIAVERKRALKDLESRMKTVQARLKKERKAVSRMVSDAVQGTLATFNIPSRQEIADLTRKVDELSKKIDSIRR
jgi:polyhydroxyalkanoate synthesis regulator phasin